MEDEIKKVVNAVATQGESSFYDRIVLALSGGMTVGLQEKKKNEPKDGDAECNMVKSRETCISYLQRELGVGYNQAIEIIEKLEQHHVIVSPLPGSQKRAILIQDRPFKF